MDEMNYKKEDRSEDLVDELLPEPEDLDSNSDDKNNLEDEQANKTFSAFKDPDGTQKFLVTYEKVYDSFDEARKDFDNLDPSDYKLPEQEDLPTLHLGGIEVSSNTTPENDLLVVADFLDKQGFDNVADIVFVAAQKINLLRKK